MSILGWSLGALVAGGGAYTAYEAVRNSRIHTIPANTPRVFDIQVHSWLRALEDGAPFDAATLDDTLLFIQSRFDCSDFLANSLVRAVYAYGDTIRKAEPALMARIERTLLGFKYYMDQPGQDSMCYWSENHQILYAGLEYLVGHLFVDRKFDNSGELGAYHKARGKARILAWIGRRFAFGFTEWYSNNYYLEDIVAMSNILEFAPDEQVSRAMTSAMHLILFDMATQSFHGSFLSTGGRMYEMNKKSARSGCQLNRVMAQAFDMEVLDQAHPLDEGLTFMTRDMDYNFLLNKKYRTPEVLKKIARDQATRVIRASSSVDLDEGKQAGLFGTNDMQLAAQWEMEAFSNHQVIAYTIRGIKRYGMMCSEFFAPLKMLDLTILRPFHAAISKALKPFTDGTPTQRANTYTYRTPNYMMATAQAYLPGGLSDQHHLWNLILSDDLCVFTTQPTGVMEEKGALSKSPGYWVGNGRNPHCAQHEGTMLAIYQLPKKKIFLEKKLYDYTHAYFPQGKFDQAIVEDRFAFGRYGKAYVALVAATPIQVANDEELKQFGDKQYWVCTCSDAETETFEDFMDRVKNAPVTFDGDKIVFGGLSLQFRGDFSIDGAVQNLQYKRFDSAYCVAERGAKGFVLACDGERMELGV